MKKELTQQPPPVTQPDMPASAPKGLASRIPVSFERKIAEVNKSEHGSYEWLMTKLGNLAGLMGAYIPLCFCCPNPFKVVPQGHVGILSHFGKAVRIVDPGLYFVNVNTDSLRMVSIAMVLSDVPRQHVITKDNVNIDIDSVVYWYITDPYAATFYVQDVHRAIIERTMTTLRDSVGAYELQTLIENRDDLAEEIEKIIGNVASSWGVVVESILIKDIKFSRDLEESLASAAKQKRVGESKIITAKAEVESAKLMREAADILNTSAAMQIRYLETMQQMSKQAESKVIYMPAADLGPPTSSPSKKH